MPRLELPDMTLGRAVYGVDVVRSGCLYATVARSPVVSGATPRYDPKPALAIPGVRKVLAIDSGVAVVAENPWSAFEGRSALQIRWSAQQDDALDSDWIRERLRAALRRKGSLARSEGDTLGVLAAAPQAIEAFYETPYLAHATLEPMNCTAHVTRDACEVWAPTQAQDDATDTAASESGLPKQAVQVHTTFLGGGFGRRLHSDFVAEAVQLSRKLRAPVQVLWSRDDDLQHDFYRPANAAWLRAVLRRGRPLAWFQRVAGPDLALDGVDIPYAIPNIQVEWVRCDPGVPTGPWRSVGESQNAFAVESFMDELARAAGADPLEFRLGLLPRGSRHRGVLELAAQEAHWGAPLPPGHGRGVAVYHSYGSWVAQVAEVSMTPDGQVRLHRIVCGIDCGIAVNPDTVTAQLEGAVAFALSAALFEAITLERGRIRQASFEDYRLLVMREMPAVDVHILPSREPPGGVGEPGVPPLAAAVANALCAASGKRVRKLPLQGQ
jgi:isoquinoline 1-oxidoreductase beta subunit